MGRHLSSAYANRVRRKHNLAVGQRMRLARKAAGVTLDQMAEYLGYTSRSQVTKIEAGQTMVAAATVVMFCEAIGTDVKELMG